MRKLRLYLHRETRYKNVGLSLYLDLHTPKPVLGVSDKARLKPISSATETEKPENSLEAILDMIRLPLCCSQNPQIQDFCQGPSVAKHG